MQRNRSRNSLCGACIGEALRFAKANRDLADKNEKKNKVTKYIKYMVVKFF